MMPDNVRQCQLWSEAENRDYSLHAASRRSKAMPNCSYTHICSQHIKFRRMKKFDPGT